MSISLDKFVNVNIVHHENSTSTSTRDTVILFTDIDKSLDGKEFTSVMDEYEDVTSYNGKLTWDFDCFYDNDAKDSETSGTVKYTKKTDVRYANLYKYLKVYFDNGGIKCRLAYSDADLSTKGANVSDLIDKISKLDDKYIVIAFCTFGVNPTSTSNLENINSIAKALDEMYYGKKASTIKGNTINLSTKGTVNGIHRKLLLARATYSDYTGSNVYSSNSLIVKYATERADDEDSSKFVEQTGDEMSIGAYLSNIDVYSSNLIKGYCYTAENCYPDTTDGDISKEVDDTMYESLSKRHWTFVYNLANANRAIGGDTCAGYSFVNEFVLIVLHQTLTNQLIKMLVNKPIDSTVCGLINATLSTELNKYISNGYLTTTKTWYDDNLTVKKNGVTYTIIEYGTNLTSGYKVVVLPLSSLTRSERQEHKAPSAYIILADHDEIRTIDINGEVI